jgi:hypothetical protein
MKRRRTLHTRVYLSTTLRLVLSLASLSALRDVTRAQAPESPKDVFPIDVSWLSPLFIDVRVNGSEPMHFILDSASTYSMLRKKEAEALNLKTTNGTTLNGGGGAFRLDFAKADLQVGKTTLRNVELGVTDLSPAYAGILGGDLFEAYVVEIDYERGKLSLFGPGTFRAPPNAKEIPVNIRARIPSVQASLRLGNTTATGEFRIDTGSGAPITLHHPFAERNSFPPPGAPTQSSKSASLGGSADWIKARGTSVSIGSIKFDRPIIEAFASSRGAGGGTVLAGMIGNEILRRFRVTFDCPHRRMFLVPNRTRHRPFEVDMSGLGFGPDYRIFSVAPGSVAEKAGLKVDDVIMKLDGKHVERYGLAGAHDQLMRNSARCQLYVRRGERVVRVTLQLKRLL